ncbi:MAG: amidase family protein [Mycobacteriales bacterium]
MLEEYLARIEALDRRGPALHALIGLEPDALTIAATLNSELRAHGPRGPLHGLPVLVKDNIDTAATLPTTAGSAALATNRADADATVVAKLRSAGAVVFGKTNLSEWANFRSPRSTSGWSALGGLTRNPYALDRSAGGSSSGSAAAVAAGFAPVALGTETDGSILCPAALCGCVGVKPTVGLTSRQGVIPISSSQDSVGPIARSVALAAATLDAIAERGGHLAGLSEGVAGLRVGIPRKICWGRRGDLDAAAQAGIDALAAAGAVIVEDPGLTLCEPDGLSADELIVMLHEFHAGLDAYLAAHPGASVRSLSELISFDDVHPTELTHFGQELLIEAAATADLNSASYLEARARCRRAGREDGIDAALGRFELDALAAPSYPPAWRSDLVLGDPPGLYASSQLPAVAGYPAVTVPVGLVAGLPVGLTLFSTAYSEGVLLRLAGAVETALGPLPPPTFRPGA